MRERECGPEVWGGLECSTHLGHAHFGDSEKYGKGDGRIVQKSRRKARKGISSKKIGFLFP